MLGVGSAARWIGRNAVRGGRIIGKSAVDTAVTSAKGSVRAARSGTIRGATASKSGLERIDRVAQKRGVGKAFIGTSVGAAMVGAFASETLNPEGYAGDIAEDLTGSRNYQAQMFGASMRNQFTASQPRMGRPGRRRPQAPPGDIVFGMYNLR